MNIETEIKELYNQYYDISKVVVEDLWSFGVIRENFVNLLKQLDQVVTRKDLDQVLDCYKDLENQFFIAEQKVMQQRDEVDDSKDMKDEFCDKVSKKEEEIEKKEEHDSSMHSQYHQFEKDASEVVDVLDQHRKNIQEYIRKIDLIKAREITVYRSNIMDKSLSLLGRVMRRSLESKVLSAVVPKKVADAYFAMKLIQDTKEIIKRDDLVITRYEVDNSYYEELLHDQFTMKGYRGVIEGSLIELKKLKEEYRNICINFPDEYIYQENMKKLDFLEKTLIDASLQIDEVVHHYDDAMEYNNQKIKALSD